MSAASRRRRPGACTRATSTQRSSHGSWRSPRAGTWYCVSRISTASARRASTSTRSSVISRPWDSSGTRGRTSSMIATRPMPRHSGALKPGGFCTRASARGPTFTPPRRPTGARSSSMPAPAAICRTRRWRRAGQRDARRAGELPWTAARSPSKTSFREPTRKSSTATAATSSYAAPTARSPISWQWWWTMPPRASIRSCAASICFAPRRSSATSRIFSGCRTPPMRTFRCLWPSRTGASRNAIGTRP